MRYALRNGMTIGAHSAGHPNMTLLTEDQVRFQMDQTNLYLNRTLGIVPRFFRFPYGATDDSLDRIVKEEYGMTSVFWSTLTGDSNEPSATPEEQVDIYKRFNQTSKDIILMHDTHERLVTGVNVLKQILNGECNGSQSKF